MLALSPVDHVFTGRGAYPIEFVFSYHAPLDSDRLLQGLQDVLPAFPHLRSRLTLQDNQYGLRADTAALTLEVQESSPKDLTDKRAFYSLLNSVVSELEEPTLKVRITRIGNQSYLAVSASHAVVDGYSYFYFLSAWASAVRGEKFLPPDHNRKLLFATSNTSKAPADSRELFERTGLYWTTPRTDLDRAKISWEKLVFSPERQKELFAATADTTTARLSFNDVLTAWLWQQNSRTIVSSQSYISIPVDVRRTLTGVSPAYFGNAVSSASAMMPKDDVANTPLGKLATTIRQAVNAISEPRIKGALDCLDALRRQHGPKIFASLHVAHPEAGLLVTNLSRMPLAGLDFGSGAPSGAEILTPARNIAVVLPHHAGGVEVQICRVTA